jgi:hypothetical protein
MVLRLNYGNAVTGDQRFPRPALEQRFMRTLSHSAGIKMFGLRRIGKSTLLNYAMEQLDGKSQPYIYVNAQGLSSLGDLLSRLFEAMPREGGFMNRALGILSKGPAQAALQAIAKGTGHEEGVLAAYWQMVSGAIRRALESDAARPTLIIDEFTYLIGNMLERETGREEVDKLLAGMREWRAGGMSMLLTGSLGLTALTRTSRLMVEHLNDLQPFAIPELTPEEARAFIREATSEPSQGRWTEAHTQEFIKQSGVLYPCFLVRGLLQVNVEHPADPTEFGAIFAEHVRPDLHADFFNQFDRRFKAYAGLPGDEQQKLILPALKAIMDGGGACPHEAIPLTASYSGVDLSVALTMLWEDGFIQFTEDVDGERSWRPASSLARAWWKRSKLA